MDSQAVQGLAVKCVGKYALFTCQQQSASEVCVVHHHTK